MNNEHITVFEGQVYSVIKGIKLQICPISLRQEYGPMFPIYWRKTVIPVYLAFSISSQPEVDTETSEKRTKSF
jgi:hypothetical protein